MAGNGDDSSCGFIGETCINNLPDECLTIVVKFLENWVDRDAFGLTCHRWLKIQSGIRRSVKIQSRDSLSTSHNFSKYLGRLFDRFTALHSVSLSGCTEIPDSALTVFQSADSGIAVISERCPELRSVIISFCRNIQGEGFEKNLSLQCLEAESCCLTDAGLSKTVKGGSLQFLNLSHLHNSIAIGLRGFGCIGMACTNLQFLYMRMCRTLENLAVIEISKGCPLLKEWNLAVCQEVSVAGWQGVAQNCRNLEILHVNRCRHFCNTSMHSIKNGCPKLSSLYLHGCPNLTSTTVELFKQSRSAVRIIPQECMCVAPFADKFLKK
eukprot:PITA_16964